MAHLLHALQVAGVDHVGIGLDWDGGGGVKGMEDVGAIPRITAALLDAGYSRDALSKVWSGNVFRELAAAEAEPRAEAKPQLPRTSLPRSRPRGPRRSHFAAMQTGVSPASEEPRPAAHTPMGWAAALVCGKRSLIYRRSRFNRATSLPGDIRPKFEGRRVKQGHRRVYD